MTNVLVPYCCYLPCRFIMVRRKFWTCHPIQAPFLETIQWKTLPASLQLKYFQDYLTTHPHLINTIPSRCAAIHNIEAAIRVGDLKTAHTMAVALEDSWPEFCAWWWDRPYYQYIERCRITTFCVLTQKLRDVHPKRDETHGSSDKAGLMSIISRFYGPDLFETDGSFWAFRKNDYFGEWWKDLDEKRARRQLAHGHT
jgi:hypothetical protein